MTDESSELEILSDLALSGSDSSSEEEQPARRTQRRAQYQLDRSFGTVEEYTLWCDEGGLDGWELKNSSIAKKTGTETQFYW